MLTIGLTGGIGSGKTTVADSFAQHDITVIDADQISSQLTQPNQPAFQHILKHFGQAIINEQGQLNRGQLRKIIFDDPKQRTWLEQLLHPLIRKTMQDMVNKSQTPYCIVVIPLLSESSAIDFIDRVCVVDTSEQLQIERASLRDDCDSNLIKQIMLSQHDRSRRLAIADDIIDNNSSIEELEQKVTQLHQHYLSLATQGASK